MMIEVANVYMGTMTVLMMHFLRVIVNLIYIIECDTLCLTCELES